MSKRWFISRLSALGDVVCSLPVAHALKQIEPDSHICWGVKRVFRPIVERCGYVDEVVEVEQTVDCWRRLRTFEKFDVAFDIQGLTKSAWVAGAVPATQRFGFHWQRELARLFSQPVVPREQSLHVVDQFVDVVRAVGEPGADVEFGFAPTEDDLNWVRERVATDGRTLVCINPGSAVASKQWPAELWAKLLDLCPEYQFLIVGSKAEFEKAKSIGESAANKPTIFSGQTSIAQLIGVLGFVDLHVGGDTGTTHISAALGKRCVALYGPTNPARNAPYGSGHAVLHEPEGIDLIAPEAVAESLKAIAPAVQR